MRLYEFTTLLENRRNQVAKSLGDRLVQRAKTDEGRPLDKILDALEAIDFTKNKSYLIWLANQYIRGQFRLHDAPRIKKVLADFEKLKPRLDQKNIEQYDFYRLEDAIDKIMNPEVGVGKVVGGTFEVPEDTDVLYNGPYGLLASPRTEEASCKIGSGTKWCTAGIEDNQFDYYSKEAPLYIWRDRSGERYQFWFGDEPEVMDDRNRPVDLELVDYFRKEHPVLKKFFHQQEKELYSNPDRAANYISMVLGGDAADFYYNALKTDPENIFKVIPAEDLSVVYRRHPEIVLNNIDKYVDNLRYVPDNIQNDIYFQLGKKDVISRVLEKNCRLDFVSPEIRGRLYLEYPDLVLKCLQNKGFTFEYLPEEVQVLIYDQNPNLVKDIVSKYPEQFAGLSEYIQESVFSENPNLVLNCIEKGTRLADISRKIRTAKISIAAVVKDPYQIQDVPPQILRQNPKLVQYALSRDRLIQRLLPADILNKINSPGT
jgi:hypothetical protein